MKQIILTTVNDAQISLKLQGKNKEQKKNKPLNSF